MGEENRKSANKDASGIPRPEFLKRTILAGTDVGVAHRLLNETAVAATNHSPITMPGMTKTTMAVRLNINGSDYQLRIQPRTTLLDALRDTVGLTGTKKECDRGEYGARCNRHEADLYRRSRSKPHRETMLCPVLWCSPSG